MLSSQSHGDPQDNRNSEITVFNDAKCKFENGIDKTKRAVSLIAEEFSFSLQIVKKKIIGFVSNGDGKLIQDKVESIFSSFEKSIKRKVRIANEDLDNVEEMWKLLNAGASPSSHIEISVTRKVKSPTFNLEGQSPFQNENFSFRGLGLGSFIPDFNEVKIPENSVRNLKSDMHNEIYKSSPEIKLEIIKSKSPNKSVSDDRNNNYYDFDTLSTEQKDQWNKWKEFFMANDVQMKEGLKLLEYWPLESERDELFKKIEEWKGKEIQRLSDEGYYY